MSDSEERTYNANVNIKELPLEVDRIITQIAALRGVQKWRIQREALIEYANNHKQDIAELAKVS